MTASPASPASLCATWPSGSSSSTSASSRSTSAYGASPPAVAPELVELHGVGPDTASTLLITAGDNPERLVSDRSFAALTGCSPIPASSGKTHRHRLNRGGDRQANSALWRVTIVRLVSDERSRTTSPKACAKAGARSKRSAASSAPAAPLRGFRPDPAAACGAA